MKFTPHDGGRAAAGFKGKAPGDCVCRAIAIAAELPYKDVYDALNALSAKHERPRRLAGGRGHARSSSARTGVSKALYRRYLNALGWIWTPTMHVGSGCKVHLRDGELPSTGRLIVVVSKHLCAVINGVIHDLYDPSRDGKRCVYGYWTKPGVELTAAFSMLQEDLALAMTRHKERTGQSATLIVLGKTEWQLMRNAMEMGVTDLVGIGSETHMTYRSVAVVRDVSARAHGIGVFTD